MLSSPAKKVLFNDTKEVNGEMTWFLFLRRAMTRLKTMEDGEKQVQQGLATTDAKDNDPAAAV